MPTPNILVFSGSIRTGSFNETLAAHVAGALKSKGAEVDHISLKDYPLPLFNTDEQIAEGLPENAYLLGEKLLAANGVFIACPEYNASITPLLKNTFDWISRLKSDERIGQNPFSKPVFALGAASPGGGGGLRGLISVRYILGVGLGALVLPDQVAVPNAANAFGEDNKLVNPVAQAFFEQTVDRLISASRVAWG